MVSNFSECVEWFDGDCFPGHEPRVVCSLTKEVVLETSHAVNMRKPDAVGMVAATHIETFKSDDRSRHFCFLP